MASRSAGSPLPQRSEPLSPQGAAPETSGLYTPQGFYSVQGVWRIPSEMAVSDAGSLLSERVEAVAAVAAESLVTPGIQAALCGLACMLIPPLVLLLAPLMVLLLPLLLPAGLTLLIFGLSRAGIGLSFAHRAAHRAPPLDEKWRLGSAWRRADQATGGTGLSPPPLHTIGLGRMVKVPSTGSIRELGGVTAQRGEQLVRQTVSLLRSNVARATHDISDELQGQLQAMQQELHLWVGANSNLKPYCDGQIGWLVRAKPKRGDRSPGDLAGPDHTARFHALLGELPPAHELLSTQALAALPLPAGKGWADYSFLLLPGLLTKWYPQYMSQLTADMRRLGLEVSFSCIDTDQAVRVNAARLRHEVLELAEGGGDKKQVVLLGHSKGAVDGAAALSLFPELCEKVAGLVSLQGPHSGSAIAHDLANTSLQKSIALGALERLLRGCKHAVLDLSYTARQEFVQRHPYPAARVPALCVATCDRRPCSLLKPVIDYVALRYGEVSDGCVCQTDALLPGTAHVLLNDMDHFGPAWSAFPATDSYDPARLWLVCVSLALCDGALVMEVGDDAVRG